MISLKKWTVLCVALLLLYTTVSGEGIIREDFYLNGREFATFREKQTILPNTLILSLSVGEAETITAEVSPSSSLCETLSWRLVEESGAAKLLPSGENCTVYGVSEGEETVEISLDGESSVFVRVNVIQPQEIRLRSFENEPKEEEETFFSECFVVWSIRVLIFGAAASLLVAAYLLIKKKGEFESER